MRVIWYIVDELCVFYCVFVSVRDLESFRYVLLLYDNAHEPPEEQACDLRIFLPCYFYTLEYQGNTVSALYLSLPSSYLHNKTLNTHTHTNVLWLLDAPVSVKYNFHGYRYCMLVYTV